MQHLTNGITEADLCELATETNGSTAETVSALIEGVLTRYGHLMDEAAHAALNAIRDYHVPMLQDAIEDMERPHRAD